MSADATMPVGIVIERRASNHPWQEHTWHPIGILPNVAHTSVERWKLLKEGEGWTQYLAGSLRLDLFRGETEGYRVNLSQDPPAVYVVLRKGEQADDMEIEPFLATVCPYEAMGYDDGGDEIVESVPMPPEIAAWVAEFIERYHVDVPFKKRRNRRHDDDARARAPIQMQKNREGLT